MHTSANVKSLFPQFLVAVAMFLVPGTQSVERSSLSFGFFLAHESALKFFVKVVSEGCSYSVTI
jgi:hypothetical protein